jgi:choline dehydrogenase-like flavoprotein
MQVSPAGPADGSDAPHDAEAIVIGSGFGGAVAACRLAQAGLQVLILERGRRYEAHDFPTLPVDSQLLPDFRRWTWQHDQGLWDVVDLEEILSVQAAGYGGGSLIYANVHLRPPAIVFDARWPAVYHDGAILQGFYDLAAHMLEVAPVSAHPSFQGSLIKSDQMSQAAKALGRETFYPPLAIRYADGPNEHGVEQQSCQRCGNCCTGCPHRAKNTLDANYLAVAERHGARAMTQCEVTGITDLDGGGFEVRCIDHLSATSRTLRSRYLFLCAGSVHSTRLLARAHLREGARPAQALAGVGYFPGGDAVGMVYQTAHELFPSFGPTITTALVHWEPDRRGSFFLIEDGGYGKQLERALGVLRAPAWVGRNRLSAAGAARVGPSRFPRPQAPPDCRGRPAGVGDPLDAVLDALAQSDFRAIFTPEVYQSFSSFIDELKAPMLFPAVVDATVERALRERYQRTPLVKHLDPDGPLLRLVTRFAKWLAYRGFGSPTDLAGHALRAMLSAGDLGRAEVGQRVLGYNADGADRRAMLLAMGRDAASGALHYDAQQDRLTADLDLFDLAPGYAREELLMTDLARALGGELRTNPAWAFLGKPITVHNQGGCRMSDGPDQGVTTDEGEVRGCSGLYVLDGSLLCGSVGANPSATILAIAERNVLAFIRRLRGPSWPDEDSSPGATDYQRQREGAKAWADRARTLSWNISPPISPSVDIVSRPLGLGFKEEMEGYYEPTSVAPRGDAQYRRSETRGCPDYPIKLEFDVAVETLAAFFEDERHRMKLSGSIAIRLPSAPREPKLHRVKGSLELMVPRVKPYAIRDARRRAAQISAAQRYTARPGNTGCSRERFMKYNLTFEAGGQYWCLWGYKRIRKQPGIDAWRATSSLFCQLHGPFPTPEAVRTRSTVAGAGVVHVELTSFLFDQIRSMQVTPKDVDPARRAWALLQFCSFFFGTLQRIYAPELRTALDTVLRMPGSSNHGR